MGKKGCGHHKEIFFELSFMVTKIKVKFYFYQHYFLTQPLPSNQGRGVATSLGSVTRGGSRSAPGSG